MPRRQIQPEQPSRRAGASLVEKLVNELKSQRDSGQPWIEEEEFPSGKIRVNVIWDEWDRLPYEERTATILDAYMQVEGSDYRDRIALASGLTVPEAYGAGMLPYHVFPAIRKSDLVTIEECRQVLIDEGASTLLGESIPQLRFATEVDAEAACKRLSEKLPGSEQIWVTTQEVGLVQDYMER